MRPEELQSYIIAGTLFKFAKGESQCSEIFIKMKRINIYDHNDLRFNIKKKYVK